eukprot:2135261-Amphidinium_carterae.1
MLKVSGATSGLSSALKNVRYGGKVLAASIYNEEAFHVPLSTPFSWSSSILLPKGVPSQS